jgi:hypothetical protein
MTDLEKVQRMAECNWKPASQYWHELYVKSQAEVADLKLKIKKLETT